MSDLPVGWTEAPLGALVEILDSVRIPINSTERAARNAGKPADRLFPYYGATGQVGEIDEFLFDEPLILLGEDGVPFLDPQRHKAYLVDGKYWVNNHAHVLRAVEPVADRRFLTAYLNAFDYTGYVTGSTRLKLTQEAMRGIPVMVAPRPEQQRIADKLDTLLVRVDACRARLDRVPSILKRFRQAVLAAATSGELTREWREAHPTAGDASGLVQTVHEAHRFAGGHKAGNAAPPTDGVHDLVIGSFPKGWGLVTLRDLVEPDRPITYGILMPGPELTVGVPYVRVADFPNDVLNLKAIRRTSHSMDEEFKRSRLRGGDLLLSIRGTVGRVVLIPDELERANITQDSARLTIQSVVNRDYVMWFLRSDLAQVRMKGAVKGVAVRGINIGDVRALQVPLPSRTEQDEIVRRVEALFAYADRLADRYTAAHTLVDRLTSALLAKTFRGELVPQDPSDEPAAAMLERIRATRIAGATQKPKRTTGPSKKTEAAPTMLNRKEITESHLTSILKERGPLTAEALWTASQLGIDDFYDQLKSEESSNFLRENKGSTSSAPRLLEVVA